jgi:dolichol-phosphate mannosyltransferase/undecaprenyl-phosphate 4-deoxy-4-formamido-L-arabinose transferase
MLISIVIPVYNSTKSLNLLFERIDQVFSKLDYEYEIIFVEDKSPNPESWQILLDLSNQHPEIKCLQLTRNFGQQAATLCGIDHASGEFIITMDDDLQHRPEDIPELLNQKNHDIVIGEFKKKYHNLFKIITSRIKGYFDYLIIGKPRHIQLTSFRLFNKTIAEGIMQIKTAYPFIPALLFYVSKDVIGVEVKHEKRFEGKTNYGFRKMVKVFSNLIINNSSFLLRMLGYVGLTTSVISFLYAILIIIRKLFYGIDIIGWASNMVAILFLGGLILFTLGIIGDYLIRIIVGVEQRPTFIVRSKKNL